FAGGALAVALVGFLERVQVDGDDGVELVLVRGDADERLLHEVVRGDAAVAQRGLHLRNGGLDDAKRLGLGLLRGEREGGEEDDGNLFHGGDSRGTDTPRYHREVDSEVLEVLKEIRDEVKGTN